MKRNTIVVIAGGVLVLAFVVGATVYRSERAESTKELATAADSPLLRAGRPMLGPAEAKVHIVEFMDPGCETCRLFHPFVKGLLARHEGKIKLTIRYVPLHQGSDVMVAILEAARKQDKFWPTLEVMFEAQPHWASHHHPEPDKIWQFLPHAGLDIEQLKQDMQDPAIAELLRQDVADARALGVRKTPSFFVNGNPLTSFGHQQLNALVEEQLAQHY